MIVARSASGMTQPSRREFLATTATALAAYAGLPSLRPSPGIAHVTRRIFTSSGGVAVSSNLRLMRYLLALTGKEEPVITFLPTAQADSAFAIRQWYELMNDLPCRPRHLGVFGSSRQMAAFGPRLLSSDIIFVGPGSTLNAIALWKAQGIDSMLRTAWERGIILSGESAGLVCWFEQGVTDSRPERLTAMDGLGFLPGSVCPHYDSERERRPNFRRMVQAGEIKPGYGCDDWTGMLFEDARLVRVVASRPGKLVYRVSIANGIVSESALPVHQVEGN
jgi:peptidase E